MNKKLKHIVDINFWNKELKSRTPNEIINWALKISDNRIVTTSFGLYSEVLLSTMSYHQKEIKVIWCDTLFNTSETYIHASKLTEKYNLNVYKYQALLPRKEIELLRDQLVITDKKFEIFSHIVKIEPFQRALLEHQPDVWFTNIRVRQTEYRNKKDILSYSKNGILKVSPFYYWSDADLDHYIKEKNLDKNESYFDPIKAIKDRECGIHFQ